MNRRGFLAGLFGASALPITQAPVSGPFVLRTRKFSFKAYQARLAAVETVVDAAPLMRIHSAGSAIKEICLPVDWTGACSGGRGKAPSYVQFGDGPWERVTIGNDGQATWEPFGG